MRAAQLLLLLLRVAAVAPALAIDTKLTLDCDGPEGCRTAHLHIPPGKEGQGLLLPLIVNFHAFGSTPGLQEELSGFEAAADAMAAAGGGAWPHGFVVVTPQGARDMEATGWLDWIKWPFGYSWNAGGCCPGACAADVGDAGKPVPDVEFTHTLVAYTVTWLAKQGITADPARLYATGMSNGGMMVSRLACPAQGASVLFAAVAHACGVMANGSHPSLAFDTEVYDCGGPTPAGTRALPMLHLHGSADEIVPWGGNPTLGFPSLDEDIQQRRYLSGLLDAPAVTSYSRGTVKCTSWARGGMAANDDGNFTICRMEGSGHSWPGAPGGFCPSFGPFKCTADIAGTQQILAFFQRYTLPPAMPAVENAAEADDGSRPSITRTSRVLVPAAAAVGVAVAVVAVVAVVLLVKWRFRLAAAGPMAVLADSS